MPPGILLCLCLQLPLPWSCKVLFFSFSVYLHKPDLFQPRLLEQCLGHCGSPFSRGQYHLHAHRDFPACASLCTPVCGFQCSLQPVCKQAQLANNWITLEIKMVKNKTSPSQSATEGNQCQNQLQQNHQTKVKQKVPVEIEVTEYQRPVQCCKDHGHHLEIQDIYCLWGRHIACLHQQLLEKCSVWKGWCWEGDVHTLHSSRGFTS